MYMKLELSKKVLDAHEKKAHDLRQQKLESNQELHKVLAEMVPTTLVPSMMPVSA